MNDSILTMQGVQVGFGRRRVLDALDLTVVSGEVTVMLGDNGAGKSTLLRCLLGLLRPSAGTVRVVGHDPVKQSRQVLSRIGYVPDVPDVYPWMTVRDLLRYLRPHYPSWNQQQCAELIERLDVPQHTRFSAMSRGQGMKAMLVAALAPEPELLLLDEPFAGLDPLVREEVLQGVVEALRVGERTVLCATHELDVAARIADRIAVLQQGRIVRHGALDEVLQQAEPVQITQGLHQLLREAHAEVTA